MPILSSLQVESVHYPARRSNAAVPPLFWLLPLWPQLYGCLSCLQDQPMYYAAPQQRRNLGRGLLEFIRSVVTSAMVLVAASLIFLLGSNVLKNNAGRISGTGNTTAISSRAQADGGVSGYAPKEYDRVSPTDCASCSGFWGIFNASLEKR